MPITVEDMKEREEKAIEMYLSGIPPMVSTFIDEETLTYGYGKLSSLGEWEYEIPHRVLKNNEAKTVSELMAKFPKE